LKRTLRIRDMRGHVKDFVSLKQYAVLKPVGGVPRNPKMAQRGAEIEGNRAPLKENAFQFAYQTAAMLVDGQ